MEKKEKKAQTHSTRVHNMRQRLIKGVNETHMATELHKVKSKELP